MSEVADVDILQGRKAEARAVPTILIEVAHGCTERAEYDALASRLRSPLPNDLPDFFHANTDEGAWELAEALAEAICDRSPQQVIALVRSRLPRTLVDCNRVIDATDDLANGGVTAGVPVYVTDADDHTLLRDLHAQYQRLVDDLFDALPDTGIALFPHTYAPRSVGIERVDADIVRNMHWAYEPQRRSTWPLRAEVDLIVDTPGGERTVPESVLDRVQQELGWMAVEASVGGTYNLHPATQAARRALARPGRCLCFEVRRDQLIPGWEPFEPCRVSGERTGELARAFARGVVPWIEGR